MICIDIGNKYTTIYDGKNTLTKLTTIQFQQHNRVEIGLERGIKNVVYDIVVLLGTKYQNEQFSRYAKFYAYDFWRSAWGKIDIGVPAFEGISSKSKCFVIQTLLALYLKKLLLQYKIQYHPIQTTLKQLLSGNKFYIITSSMADHPNRYSLKQALEIAGIQSPTFINCSHSLLCSYYSKEKKELVESEEICVVEFGDRGAGVSVYRIQGFEQKIIDVLESRSINMGGYHLTKILAEYVVQKIKQQKGIDISRHTSYMSLLHSECEKVKINIITSQQRQAHIRIPDLPDDSTFGKIINQKLLMEILGKYLDQIVGLVKQMLAKYKDVKQILMFGGSSMITQFDKKIRVAAGKERKVRFLGKQMICAGVFALQEQDIVLFDASDAVYEVTGQEGFKLKLMGIGESIPDRRNEKIKFPAGELEFNFRVTENDQKIAHFILDSRPTQPEFWLNFEIDRNKLIWLYVKTDKGKINLIPNFEAINPQNIFKQAERLQEYQY